MTNRNKAKGALLLHTSDYDGERCRIELKAPGLTWAWPVKARDAKGFIEDHAIASWKELQPATDDMVWAVPYAAWDKLLVSRVPIEDAGENQDKNWPRFGATWIAPKETSLRVPDFAKCFHWNYLGQGPDAMKCIMSYTLRSFQGVARGPLGCNPPEEYTDWDNPWAIALTKSKGGVLVPARADEADKLECESCLESGPWSFLRNSSEGILIPATRCESEEKEEIMKGVRGGFQFLSWLYSSKGELYHHVLDLYEVFEGDIIKVQNFLSLECEGYGQWGDSGFDDEKEELARTYGQMALEGIREAVAAVRKSNENRGDYPRIDPCEDSILGWIERHMSTARAEYRKEKEQEFGVLYGR